MNASTKLPKTVVVHNQVLEVDVVQSSEAS